MLSITNMQLPQIQPMHDSHFHTKRRVKAACTNCKKAKARCDQQRPCSRCVQKNCAECVDAFPRRVGRRRNHYLDKIVTENEVKASGALIKSKPRKRKRRRSGKTKTKKNNNAEEGQTPPLRAEKPKTSKKLIPLTLDTTNQDQDLDIHDIVERTSPQPSGFSWNDLFEPTPSLGKNQSSEYLPSPTLLSTPKNFPFGEPDSNLFDGISSKSIPQMKSVACQEKETAPSYPFKEISNDDLLLNEEIFMEPGSENLAENHSDTASDSELSTGHLLQVQDVDELDGILPAHGLTWMESLSRDETNIFGMDSILC